MTDAPAQFEEWMVLELFGHQRIAGKVTEATIAGGAFLRVDVPDEKGGILWTRYYGPSAIYSMSPVSEEIARAMARQVATPPVTRYELPPALEARARGAERDESEGENDDDFEDDEGDDGDDSDEDDFEVADPATPSGEDEE